jgi:ribosomal protein S14
MPAMFKEGAHNLKKKPCSNCGEESFLQKDFDVCPHCLGWDHEIVREVYD